MKTSKLIVAALITGTALIATSAMAQQGGVGGRFTQKSTVQQNGKLTVLKGGKAYLGNTKLVNSRINGNADIRLTSIINGQTKVGKDARLMHGAFNMNDSQITGNVKADLQAKSKRITLEKGAKYKNATVDLYNGSKINSNLDITATGEAGNVKVGKNATLLLSTLEMNGSTINGNAKFNLKSKVGNVTLGKGAWVGIGSVSMTGSKVGGPMTVNSNVNLGNVEVGKKASFLAGAVRMENSTIGGSFDFTSDVKAGNVTLEDGAEVSMGSFQSS